MIITFSEEQYKLIKSVDFTEIKKQIRFIDENHALEMNDSDYEFKDMFGEVYEMTPINALLMCIDAEITRSGLSDDQGAVLPRGHELYELYDSIYYFQDT